MQLEEICLQAFFLSIGNIRSIGWLFKVNMLPEVIMRYSEIQTTHSSLISYLTFKTKPIQCKNKENLFLFNLIRFSYSFMT